MTIQLLPMEISHPSTAARLADVWPELRARFPSTVPAAWLPAS